MCESVLACVCVYGVVVRGIFPQKGRYLLCTIEGCMWVGVGCDDGIGWVGVVFLVALPSRSGHEVCIINWSFSFFGGKIRLGRMACT